MKKKQSQTSPRARAEYVRRASEVFLPFLSFFLRWYREEDPKNRETTAAKQQRLARIYTLSRGKVFEGKREANKRGKKLVCLGFTFRVLIID